MYKAGGKNFKTKSTLINYCKFVLNGADKNSFLEGEWFSVLDDVLKMHDCYEGKTEGKTGGQSYKIGVRTCSINPRNRQFFVLREDGSDTDFSFYKAIQKESKESKIKKSLRASITGQTISYKDAYFAENQDRNGYVVCPETNLKVKKKDSHIDHFPKHFDAIVQEWVTKKGVTSEGLEIVPAGDNGAEWEIVDKGLLQDFVDFHKEQAQYRIVLNKVNLQRAQAPKFSF